MGIFKNFSVSGLLGTGITAAAGLYNAKRQEKLQESFFTRQQDFSDRQARIAYERQQEFANQQNLYNSPIAQRQRLEEAGLNAALIYGDSSGTISAASPSVGMGDNPSPFNPQNYVGDALNNAIQNTILAFRLRNETKVADAQAKNLAANTNNTNVNTDLTKETFDAQVESKRLENLLQSANIEGVKANTALARANKLLTDAKTDTEKQEAQYKSSLICYQEMLNDYLPERHVNEMAKICADTRQAIANADFSAVQKNFVAFNAMSNRITAISSDRNSKKNNLEQVLSGIITDFIGDKGDGKRNSLISSSIKTATDMYNKVSGWFK